MVHVVTSNHSFVFSISQIWSNEVCGCRCRDSAVAECTQRKMGIDVDCNCVNVLASMHRIGSKYARIAQTDWICMF